MSVAAPNQIVLEKATRGHRSMLLAQGLKLVCKLVSVFLLARLVAPVDHGLFAMASSVVLLLALFRDAGLGAAAVRAPVLDEVQLHTLFWCHLGLGVLLAAVAAGLAPLAAQFYDTPAVTPLLISMSGAFIAIGAGGFARTQLERNVRFVDVSWIEGLAAVTGTVAMVSAAIWGAGAYSFVAYLIVSESVATVLAWRALRWKPQAPPRWSSLQDFWKIGAEVTGYHVIVHLVQQMDGIVVGRLFGAHALGLYNRANQLLALPQLHVATPLNQVAMATLSRLGSDSRDFIAHARSTATAIAHLVLPLFAVCIVLPEETVRLILGPQWTQAALLLRWLALAAAASTVTSLAYAVNVAAGQTRRLVISAVLALPLTLAAIWLGAQQGPLGVAKGIASVNMLLVVPRLWWALRELPSGLQRYLGGLLGPVGATLALSTGLWVGRSRVEMWGWPARFAIAVSCGLLAVALLTAVWPRLREEWRMVLRYLPLPRIG